MAVLALCLVLAAGPSRARPIPAAPGTPGFVSIAALEGLPREPSDAKAFLEGLRGPFSDEYLLTERPPTPDGMARVSLPLTNRFRLTERARGEDAWQMRVAILEWSGPGSGAPPASDTTLAPRRGVGCRVAIVVTPPARGGESSRPVAVSEDLRFDAPFEPRRELFTLVGRAVGLLGLEVLHHRSAELAPDTRLRLDRATRGASMVRRPDLRTD